MKVKAETMRIKICGITNLTDALAAVDVGADMLGFNFYSKSPRYISPADCAGVMASLRNRHCPITAIGIFVNADAASIANTLDACGLDLAQLSGDETPDTIARLWGRAYKAIRPRSVAEAFADLSRYAPMTASPPALLIDAHHAHLYGGTGQTADWSVARSLANGAPILLAGGLTPDNVAEAIRAVNPWGVDVASGVESAPGKKDHQKVSDFVRATRSAVAQMA